MIGDKLTFDYDSDEHTVWLIVTSASGVQQKELILLRDGFGVDDVSEAVMATGWIGQVGDEMQLVQDISCASLRDVVDAMLGYFVQSGVPGIELKEIQSAVSEYDSVHELRGVLSPYAFAWLDIMVRDDLADVARSATRIWSKSKIVIDVARHCDRRVAELVAHYSSAASPSKIGPLAASMPTRQATSSRARHG